ncbi:MAG: phosphate ABC transporter permease PstA [Oscillospiraceae bacterium]
MKNKRALRDNALISLLYLAAGITALLVVGIIGFVLVKGLAHISWSFLTSSPSALKNTIGILPNILNTLYLILLAIAIALPIGVGAAVYLTEYDVNKKLVAIIEFATETLAGLPSILYGLVGMLFFCRVLKLQTSLISGSLTLVIMILPTIIRTTQEALKTVPLSYREGAHGLGATRWYMIRTIVLPSSIDGIVTGCILAIGRIVGESAALLFTAGVGTVIAGNIVDAYRTSGGSLAVALYVYVYERAEFDVGFAIAAVLMLLVFVINFAAKKAGKSLKSKGEQL